MATIKERAKEIFENYPHPYEMQYDDNAYFDGEQVCDMMVKIATEQEQITQKDMIYEAVNEFIAFLNARVDNANYQLSKTDIPYWAKDFQKALEEKI